MDATSVVATVCAHQDLLVQLLAVLGGSSLVVSPVAWLAARYGKLPVQTQAILQLVAGNLVHAFLGEPSPRPPASNVTVTVTPSEPAAPPARQPPNVGSAGSPVAALLALALLGVGTGLAACSMPLPVTPQQVGVVLTDTQKAMCAAQKAANAASAIAALAGDQAAAADAAKASTAAGFGCTW
jgi:hypothetical protein